MSAETSSRKKAEAVVEIEPERIAFEAAQKARTEHSGSPLLTNRDKQNQPVRLSIIELFLGMGLLVVWFGLFSGGILVGTKPYRDEIATMDGTANLYVCWIMVCMFWTITNIGVISCVSAVLGALGRRTRFTSPTDPVQMAIDAMQPGKHGLATYYVSAIMRGFGIYTLVLAGLLVMATELLLEPSQASYLRLVPTVSIISFYAGYDPTVFAGLLDRVRSFMQTGQQKS